MQFNTSQSTKEKSGRREISFNEMHLEINNLKEKKSYYEDFLNLRSDVSEGREERDFFFQKEIPSPF